MKSKRRHELQQNVLDAELAKGVTFFKSHLTHIGWVLVIGALIVMVVVYNRSQRQQRAIELRNRYDLMMTSPVRNDARGH